MSPMDEFSYFQAVIPKYITVGAGSQKQLVPADIMRVGLILSNDGTNCVVVPDPTIKGGPTIHGIFLGTNQPVFECYQKESGPLCQLEWWGATLSASSVTITVIEIRLVKWPMPGESTNVVKPSRIRSSPIGSESRSFEQLLKTLNPNSFPTGNRPSDPIE